MSKLQPDSPDERPNTTEKATGESSATTYKPMNKSQYGSYPKPYAEVHTLSPKHTVKFLRSVIIRYVSQ